MKKIVIGIFAHVDAGKTTLSEALLFKSGTIRSLGRVDDGNTSLDTDSMERERGITIFSKQSRFQWGDKEFILVDTPGHVDFSAEMERALQIIDYAILVVSGADGLQGHTYTLWNLFKRYNVPVIVFVNKMDQISADKDRVMAQLKAELNDYCIDCTDMTAEAFEEELAVCDETLLDKILEGNLLKEEKDKEIIRLIRDRRMFPCFFGAALKMVGVEELLEALSRYTDEEKHSSQFGARVYKILRDGQGNRLTFMKITGGSVKVKDIITYDTRGNGENEHLTEKINQIRLYTGDKHETVNEALEGDICCVTGLSSTYVGQGLGVEAEYRPPLLEPVLNYALILPEEVNLLGFLPKLRELEEEEPQLHVVYNEETKEINVQLMGQVQIEILKSMIWDRYEIMVSFGTGKIMYRETIAQRVEGVGHFEPLRHYAEVHVLLEPLERGSGLVFDTACSEDRLEKNWQRLILTHFEEKDHKGVLVGAPITDMKLTLVDGRAHKKHTEGGDFRQATYRAIRQGLMRAESILLEPYYSFRAEVAQGLVGRLMSDMERMKGTFGMPITKGDNSVLEGRISVAAMEAYRQDFVSMTKGLGKLSLSPAGFYPCDNQEQVVEERAYDPQGDIANTPDSVFCAHGAGFVVPWYQVEDYMHLEAYEEQINGHKERELQPILYPTREKEELWMGVDEVDRIIEEASFSNKKRENEGRRSQAIKRKRVEAPVVRVYKRTEPKEKYLLVDGYNVIFAWDDLKELAAASIDGARGRLMDILCNYQAMVGIELIVVFDAYRVVGHRTEISDYKNIHVVFTKEAETADQYIEKFAHEHGKAYDITVATSDGLEQIIIRGEGCKLVSSRELKELIAYEEKQFRERFGYVQS